MTKYREIFRLKSLGFSDRNIARSCNVSRNTVRRVIDRADELSISWPLDFGMTDGALEELLFPSEKSATDRRLPNYNYIRKELLRNGVTKKLLWIECVYFTINNESDFTDSRTHILLFILHSNLSIIPEFFKIFLQFFKCVF